LPEQNTKQWSFDFFLQCLINTEFFWNQGGIIHQVVLENYAF
jgi:aconitase A